MDVSIKILEQELKWIRENRDACPQSDEFYEGYKEGTQASMNLLRMAKQNSVFLPQPTKSAPVVEENEGKSGS